LPKKLHCTALPTQSKAQQVGSTGQCSQSAHGVGNTSQVLTLGQIIASVLSLDSNETRESDAGQHW
jgi:hypothetical protein